MSLWNGICLSITAVTANGEQPGSKHQYGFPSCGPWSITLSEVGGGQSTLSWPPQLAQVMLHLQWIDKKMKDKR